MNKHNWYFRKKIGSSVLTEVEDNIESSIGTTELDLVGPGLFTSDSPTQHSPAPNMGVDIPPVTAYNNLGKRIYTNSVINLMCTYDGYSTIGASGTVTCSGSQITLPSAGKQKYITILIYHDYLYSQQEVDGYGRSVYFLKNDSYKFRIMQGSEANSGSAVPPDIPSEGIFLCDVLLSNNTTAIYNSMINVDRRTLRPGLGSPQLTGISRVIQGDAYTATGVFGFLAMVNFKVKYVRLYADTAPQGSDLIIDINKNGTTIFTTQSNRPKIVAGSNSGVSPAPDIEQFSEGDRLTVDIDQVGSSVPGGSKLYISIRCQL